MEDWPERLAAIDWSRYETAYGSAADVPRLLLALRGPGRQAAAHALWSGLCHQHAYVSSAALPALPFLLEALRFGDEGLAVEVLDILLGLALGSVSWAELRSELAAVDFEPYRQSGNAEIARFAERIADALLPVRRLRRGINLSSLDERNFDVIARAGFDTVRLPVVWPREFAEVDRAVAHGLNRSLDVVLDVHHYDALSAEPDRHADDFLALWGRIAEHYAEAEPRLCFELLNEPHGAMTAERWNALLVDALAIVREKNPARTVLVGPVRWNIVDALPTLRLPADDHLVATVHYYSPFRFTHQGAGWLDGAHAWLGTSWGSDADRARVRADLAGAAAWARDHGVPLFLEEFGVLSTAPMAERAAWTALVRAEAERLGIGWAYWDFATDFGAYDAAAEGWHEPLVEALLGGEGRL